MTNNIREVTMYETEDGQVFKSEEEARINALRSELEMWYNNDTDDLLYVSSRGTPDFEDIVKWLQLHWDKVDQLMQLRI